MASGFEIVDEEYIEELNNKNKNEITKNITEYWRNVFEKWPFSKVGEQQSVKLACGRSWVRTLRDIFNSWVESAAFVITSTNG